MAARKKAAAKKKAAARQTKAHASDAPAVGTVITREFKGKTVRVTVTEEGFRYDRRTYPSLTALALHVTGYKAVSGPRFFGLSKPNVNGCS